MDATTESTLVGLLETMAEKLNSGSNDTAFLLKTIGELVSMIDGISEAMKTHLELIQSLQKQVNSLHRSLDIVAQGFR
jgi:hypothetical protein